MRDEQRWIFFTPSWLACWHKVASHNNLLPLLSRLKLGKSSCSDNAIPVLIRTYIRGFRGTGGAWNCAPHIIRCEVPVGLSSVLYGVCVVGWAWCPPATCSSSNSSRACFQSPAVETSVSGAERSIVPSTCTCRPPANKWCAIQALFFDGSWYNVFPLMSVPLRSLSA